MKILIYGINFAPEPVGVGLYTGEMAEYLAEAGHEVRVVTALPYYPDWKVAPGYHAWAYATDALGAIRIWRAPLWVPFRPDGRKRVLHLLSFALSSLPLLVRQWVWRPDIVWMAAPALVCAPGALLTAKATGAKSWLHIQDFEVDIAFGLGMLSGNRWLRFIRWFERRAMQGFDRLSTISSRMAAIARGKGVEDSRMVLVPNWSSLACTHRAGDATTFRTQLGIPADAVVALYSGSMGKKQGVDYLPDVVRQLQDQPDLHIVLCGEGHLRDTVMAGCQGLERVHFLPLQPSERFADLMATADIHLLPQREGAADLVLPSKLAAMLGSGKPVVAMCGPESEVTTILESGCGLVAPHGDTTGFARAIRELAQDGSLRARLGATGQKLAETRYQRESVLTALNAEFMRLNRRDVTFRVS